MPDIQPFIAYLGAVTGVLSLISIGVAIAVGESTRRKNLAEIEAGKRKLEADTRQAAIDLDAREADTARKLNRMAIDMVEPLRKRVVELEEDKEQMRNRLTALECELKLADAKIGRLQATILTMRQQIIDLGGTPPAESKS
jgi:hypothetical protein